MAFLWYCASYVPYGRTVLLTFGHNLCGAVRGCF
jgi:hypothetical protein